MDSISWMSNIEISTYDTTLEPPVWSYKNIQFETYVEGTKVKADGMKTPDESDLPATVKVEFKHEALKPYRFTDQQRGDSTAESDVIEGKINFFKKSPIFFGY